MTELLGTQEKFYVFKDDNRNFENRQSNIMQQRDNGVIVQQQ